MSSTSSDNRAPSYDSLVEALDSIDDKTRAEAVISLARHFPLDSLPLLEKAADSDTNMKIRFLARQKTEAIRKDAEAGPPPLNLTSQDRVRGSGSIDLAKIKKSLGSSDKKVRLNTVKVVMASRDPSVVDSLIEAAGKEKDEDVLCAMLSAAGLLGGKRSSAFVIKYLTNPPSVKVQVAAVKSLSLINHLTVYPYIVKAFTLKEPVVSQVAYQSLVKLGKENLVNLLKRMLFGKHQWMQRAAIRAAGNLGRNSRTMRKLLALAVKKGDEYVSAKAKGAIDKLKKGEDGAAPLSEETPSIIQIPVKPIEVEPQAVEEAESEEQRMAILQEIVDHKDRTRLQDIVKWLKDEESSDKAVATYLMGLGRLGGATEVKAMAALLESSDDRVRANAVEALGMIYERYGIEEIPDLVKPSLGDRHNRVRANAVVALEGKDEAAETLEQMVYSGSPIYQRSAIYAMSVLSSQKYKPFLDFLSRAKDKMVQKQATEVLSFLADAESVPRLNATKELKIDENPPEDNDEMELACSIINPWDSTLLSEEQAAALFSQGQKYATGQITRPPRNKPAPREEEETVAQGLFEALASTFVITTAVAFYGLAVIMIGGLSWYLLIILADYFPDPMWSIIGCFMGVLLIAAVEGLMPRTVEGNGDGVRVSRREAAKLYTMVDKIAEQIGVRKPDSIYIHPYSEIGLYQVTETPFLPFSAKPQMRIGLASMRALSISQLRSIIYAELSRVKLCDKQAYLKLVRSIDGTVQQIHEKLKVNGDARVYVNPLFYGAMLYRAIVRALSKSTMMRIVLDSDKSAARYAGREVYKAALNKYSISARLFDHDLQEIIQGASTQSTAGYTENIYSYYRDFLDGLSERRLVKLKTEIFKCDPPGDRVFPPLQKRLDAATVAGNDDSQAGPELTQAVTLLDNSTKLESAFSTIFMNQFLGRAKVPLSKLAAEVEKADKE